MVGVDEVQDGSLKSSRVKVYRRGIGGFGC